MYIYIFLPARGSAGQHAASGAGGRNSPCCSATQHAAVSEEISQNLVFNNEME